MNTKKSLFSMPFVKNDIKQYRWMSIIIFMFLAFSCFLVSRDLDHFFEFFTSRTTEWIILTVIVASLSGIMFFSYVHKVSMSTKIHSLPVTRRQIVNSKVLATSIIFLLPYFLMMLIGMIGAVLYRSDELFLNLKLILFWFITVMIIFLAFYLFSSLVTIITRSTVSAIVLTIILNVVPMMLFFGVSFIFMKLYNYSINDDMLIGLISYLSPLFGTIQGFKNGIMWNGDFTVLSYFTHFRYLLVQIVGCYLILLFAFKRKKVENTTNFIAFRGLVPVFKWGLAVLVAFFMYIIYFEAYSFSIVSYVVVGLIGTSIGYVIGNFLISKTLKVSNEDKKNFIKTLVIIGVVFTISGIIGVFI